MQILKILFFDLGYYTKTFCFMLTIVVFVLILLAIPEPGWPRVSSAHCIKY